MSQMVRPSLTLATTGGDAARNALGDIALHGDAGGGMGTPGAYRRPWSRSTQHLTDATLPARTLQVGKRRRGHAPNRQSLPCIST